MKSHVEKKFITREIDQGFTSSWELVTNLANITQGSGRTERTGSRVNIESVYLNLTVSLGAVVETSIDDVHSYASGICIVQDTMPNSVNPDVADLFFNSDYLESPRNMNNPFRFRILMREQFALNRGSVTRDANSPFSFIAAGVEHTVQKYLKCNVPVTYSASGSTIADVTGNNLFVVIFGPPLGNVSARGTIRVRYTDA